MYTNEWVYSYAVHLWNQFSTRQVEYFIEFEEVNFSWHGIDGALTKHRLKRPPGHYEKTKWVFVRGVDCIYKTHIVISMEAGNQ